MPERRRVSAATVILGAASVGLLLSPTSPQERVTLVEVDGVITPVVADYIEDAVQAAQSDGSQALVVTLDTPGGLDTSMRDIVEAFLNAEVPVIVYVSPEGARAASAGTFITMAAHVAAMAPATSIGAATPVDLQGGEITDKIINDAAAFAVSVAERRNRDVEFAEQAVREGRSITARQAVAAGVVDLIADDLDDLLSQVDGRQIESLGRVLTTGDASVTRREMGLFRSVLGTLADPNLAFIFLSIGTLAIIYEAANPGLGFAGIAGVILLLLAFFALSVLPVRGTGVALFVLGIGLLVAELFVPGVGVLAAGGTIALMLSGLFLFEGDIRVNPGVLWPSAVVLGASSLVAGRAALKARMQPPTSGAETMIGKMVTVTRMGDDASAFLEGTWWEVRTRGSELRPGAV
ncbi:MAG TPA: nodulation protein NfeD, partial [Acidimicrobiia bacterium]|nr:nodulation protein NfeD [Acidimicrobiia bacterium]